MGTGKYVLYGIGIILLIGVISMVLSGINYGTGYVKEAASVVDKEIRPEKIQQDFLWFQNQKGAIDTADQTIKSNVNRALSLKSSFAGTPYADWDRVSKQEYAGIKSDIVGNIANYNNLAKDYNVAKSTWNMEFKDFGSWPKGAPYSPDDFRRYPDSYPIYKDGDVLKNL